MEYNKHKNIVNLYTHIGEKGVSPECKKIVKDLKDRIKKVVSHSRNEGYAFCKENYEG